MSKMYKKILSFEMATASSQAIIIWRHYIYTIWRSKLLYFRQNYTTM